LETVNHENYEYPLKKYNMSIECQLHTGSPRYCVNRPNVNYKLGMYNKNRRKAWRTRPPKKIPKKKNIVQLLVTKMELRQTMDSSFQVCGG